jgi:TRAP-type C4-dicarboxylate transport system substrate-binding protein
MKKSGQILFIFFLFAVFPLAAQQKVTIKLASFIPENTPWGAALNRMADEWSRATGGEVELIVYHGGTAGNEGEMLQKIKINQIQAAVFTSIGLASVMPEILTISYPLLIRTDDELEEVLKRLRSDLDAKIQQNGFVTLAWARAGWLKIFSKAPVFTPNDLRRQKLGTNPDELQMMQAFKTMRFQMIPVGINDVLVSLNGGMIEAIYQSPVAVAAGQLFGVAKNMSTVNLAPLMGGIVVNRTAWRRIPEKHRPRLQEICKRIEAEIEGSIAALETEAIATMARYGLTINRASAQQEQEWISDLALHERDLVGPVFNEEFYRKIKAILENYRKGR